MNKGNHGVGQWESSLFTWVWYAWKAWHIDFGQNVEDLKSFASALGLYMQWGAIEDCGRRDKLYDQNSSAEK